MYSKRCGERVRRPKKEVRDLVGEAEDDYYSLTSIEELGPGEFCPICEDDEIEKWQAIQSESLGVEGIDPVGWNIDDRNALKGTGLSHG